MKTQTWMALFSVLALSACRHAATWQSPGAPLAAAHTLCWSESPSDANAVAASRIPTLLEAAHTRAALHATQQGWMLKETGPTDAILKLEIILRPYAPSSIEARREADASVGKVGGVTVAPYGRTQVAPDEEPDQELRECEVVVSLLAPGTQAPLWVAKAARIIDLEPFETTRTAQGEIVRVPDSVSKAVMKLVDQVLKPFPPAAK